MAAPGAPRFARLLLVDDEPGIRKMLSLDLRSDGYDVVTADDGPAGLEAFLRERPDIVLTDVRMPGLDGVELLRRIKQESPDTEVIMMTGHASMELAVKALQMEAGDFVTKPVKPEALALALLRAQEKLAFKAGLRDYGADLERKVEEAASRASTANRLAEVGQAVSALAHSLKNMLSGLMGGVYLASDGLQQKNEVRLRQGIEMQERNIKRMQNLVSDLLTLAKPRIPEPKLVDMAAVAREAVENLAVEAGLKGVEVLVSPAVAGTPVMADEKMILDAVMNLVGNAVDAAAATPGGRVEVSVGLRSGEAWFEVKDNGPGLSREARARIFEGFFSTKGASGTGLGLMVVKKTADEHRGRVECRSRAGRGATFRIVLPAFAKATAGKPGLGEATARRKHRDRGDSGQGSQGAD